MLNKKQNKILIQFNKAMFELNEKKDLILNNYRINKNEKKYLSDINKLLFSSADLTIFLRENKENVYRAEYNFLIRQIDKYKISLHEMEENVYREQFYKLADELKFDFKKLLDYKVVTEITSDIISSTDKSKKTLFILFYIYGIDFLRKITLKGEIFNLTNDTKINLYDFLKA